MKKSLCCQWFSDDDYNHWRMFWRGEERDRVNSPGKFGSQGYDRVRVT